MSETSGPRARPEPVELPIARPERVLVAVSTAPDRDTARAIARTLVEERLAACVNLVEPIESIYRWQGQIEQSAEVMMIVKTTRSRLPALERRLRELHPYELPELLAWESAGGSADFIDWVIAQTRRRTGAG
jgi:periplasmic divalent cation tolerance protein